MSRKHSRGRRGFWRWLFVALQWIVLSAGGLVVIALLSLQLRFVRNLVARQVEGVLASTFAGRFAIERIDSLSLTGVGGVRLRVDAPDGSQVLLVDGASVRIATWATLRSFLKKEGDLYIDIPSVKLAYVDASVDTGADGNFKLLRAFEPQNKEKEAEPSSRATVVHLRSIALQHGWVHGRPKDAPLVDADLDKVDLSLIVGGEHTVTDLATLDLYARSLPQGLDLRTHVEAHFAKPAPNGAEQAGRADLAGEMSGVPFTLRGSVEGPEVTGTFDVPKVTPNGVRRFLPPLELTQDLAAHAEVRGRLPDLHAELHVRSGKGSIDLEGRAKLGEEKEIHATLDAKGLDAHAFSRAAPRSDVGLRATIDVAIDASGDGGGTYVLDVPAGHVAGNLVPATHLDGSLKMSRSPEGATELGVSGRGDIDEPGARTSLSFNLRQGTGGSALGFQVNTSARLARTRIGNLISGSATLDARGTVISANTTTVDATVGMRASQIVSGETRVDRAALRAKLQGDIADPRMASVDINLDAQGVAVAAMSFSNVTLAARGCLQLVEATASLVPTDGPRLDANTWISIDGGLDVRNTRVVASRDDVTAVLHVGSIGVKGDDLRVQGVTLDGVGEPLRAEFAKTGRTVALRAFTGGLDIGKVGRLVRSRDIGGGNLGIDVDVTVRPATANGHIVASLTQANLGRVKDGSLQIDAKIGGRRADGLLHAKLGDVGRIDVDHFQVEIEGNTPLAAAALEKAKGRVTLDSEVDLARIRAILPHGSMPFTDMQGVLRVTGDIARSSTDEAPELELSAATRGLYLSGRGNREERDRVNNIRVEPTPPWSVEGIDLELATRIAKDSGATSFQSRLFDRYGTVVSVAVDAAAMPYRQWMKAKSFDPGRLRDLPWAAEIAVPRRELKRFPSVMKTRQMGGTLAANFHFDGSLAKPDLRVLVEANGWTSPVARGMQPLNAKVDAQYWPGEGAVDIEVATREKQLLDGTVEIRGELPGLGGSKERPARPPSGSTKLRLSDFPLETVGLLADLQVRGSVSGELAIDDLRKDARAKLALALRDLKLGRANFPQGAVNVDFDGEALRAKVRLDQKDGFVETEARAGVRWGANPTPALVEEEPAFATLKANRFRAAALLPFATGVLGELDGRIFADARIDVVPDAPAKMQGSVALERGRVQLARIGEPLHGVNAKIAFLPDGVIRLEDLVAQGSTGRINAKAVARLNGFELVGARANIRIPKSDPFPVDIDGQAIGEIDADIHVAADVTPDRRTMNVKVDIPRLHTQLPTVSTNKPQELGEAEKIRVGYFRRPRQFVILPKDAEDLEGEQPPTADENAMTTNIAIHLGDNVEIQRGTMLRVGLTGNTKIELDGEPEMSGQIHLTRGTLEVQGKKFRVERGTVTFVGEPDNPQVVVSAYWDAPDGTRVYADFVGPLKTGNVKLRSEPARPQNEILALILFGTAEGSSSTPYPTQQPNGATRAGVTVGGLATEGLSKGIDELTGLDVSAKIDTSSSANPKPEVEVQIARDISVQIAYVIGTPPPGVNPDKTFFTFDWRFKRNWSMETTFGDQGSSIVDFLWQYRY